MVGHSNAIIFALLLVIFVRTTMALDPNPNNAPRRLAAPEPGTYTVIGIDFASETPNVKASLPPADRSAPPCPT